MRVLTGTKLRHLAMTTDAVGGVWTYALDLAAGLAEHGVRTTLLVLGPSPDGGQRRASEAVPGLALATTALRPEWLADDAAEVLEAGRELAGCVARSGADSVHLNSPALLAAGRFGLPTVAMCHSCVATWWEAVRGGPLPADLAWRSELVARGYAVADALVAPSRAFAAATQAAYAFARPPGVILNGRKLPGFAPGPTAGAALFTAGRLWDEGKDLETLDRAAAALPEVTVRAAGPTDGPNGARVPLAHVERLGPLPADAVGAQLAARPIFVSTARYEPFGLAVLEAAGAGCPLLLSDIPTFRELWDGAAAFFPPGDDAALVAAARALLASASAREAAGEAARRRAARYGTAPMVAQVLALHEALLSGLREAAA